LHTQPTDRLQLSQYSTWVEVNTVPWLRRPLKPVAPVEKTGAASYGCNKILLQQKHPNKSVEF